MWPSVEAGAGWLARVQGADGGVPSGYDGDHPVGLPHTDCTAQAIRIWVCSDPARYRDAIRRGLGFLARMTCGAGLRYRPGSDDINTWATMFAAQARRWARQGGTWQWIV